MNAASHLVPHATFATIHASLLARREVALLDVREEDPHAQAHPLFAANLPLARIELDAYAKLPRRDVPIVTVDDAGDDDGEAQLAARRLLALGYVDVAVLAGGVHGWQAAGGEVFRDVNVPSKAFGELVESERHTPSLAAEEVQALIDARADVVIVDARRFDEYQTMSIPTATSVPGAELVLRVAQLAPRPQTRVIVNCAGRTRSIIGTQSLINAGLPNPVAALRNGTIGWTLAGQKLDRGQQRRFDPQLADSARIPAASAARRVADAAGVGRVGLQGIAPWHAQDGRTSYFFDVRSAEEYALGHLPGFRSAPGGQLVQETEMLAPVRGARLVLADDDGVRANMSASWLAQMGWEVHVVDGVGPVDLSETGAWQGALPASPEVELISAQTLAQWLDESDHHPDQPDATVVLDLTSSANYRQAHIPGAWFILRSRLASDLQRIPRAARYVLTCQTSLLALFAASELAALVAGARVVVLDGGTRAWRAAGLASESGASKMASEPIDRYRRPYEGTDTPREAMQAYLDWEYGLVTQLARDGTHHFKVL